MAEQQKKSVPFKRQNLYQQPYFDAGQYIFEIIDVDLNRSGDPIVKMKAIHSFDNRRINSFYARNFHMQGTKSEKARMMWNSKLRMLEEALGFNNPDEVTDLGVFIGQHVLVEFTDAGYEPIPNFYNANSTNGILSAYESTKAA